MRRRALLLAALATGCGSSAPEPKPAPRPSRPDVRIAQLGELLTSVGLEWLVLARPRDLLATAWLRDPLARLLKDERLDMLAQTTAIDLRQVPELALASYRGSPEGVVFFVVRHPRLQLEIERKFRERLTSEVTRSIEGHQLVGLWGRIGLSLRGFAAIGRDVVGYQYGGTARRGPARIALLYARGELDTVPTVPNDPALGVLAKALGDAPLSVMMPGPFEGEIARGARGLLGAAESVGASLQPTERRTLRLEIVLVGNYSQPEEESFLMAAWQDLAKADLGHLLGLHEPVVAPEIHRDGVLRLRTELDAERLLRGLSAATVDSVREMMR